MHLKVSESGARVTTVLKHFTALIPERKFM